MTISRLTSLCSLTILLESGGMSIAGFGTPLILAHANATVRAAYAGDLVKSYDKPADMLTDGWLATDGGYLEATALCSQPGRPSSFKVGIRAAARASTHIVTLTPTSSVVGTVYSGTIAGVAWSYTTVADDDDIPKVVAKLVTAIDTATSGITVAAVGTPVTHLSLTSDTAGTNITLTGLTTNLLVADTTADPGIATDLAAVLAQDSDWYALLIDGYGAAEIAAAANWVEANTRAIFVPQTSDSACYGSGSSDILSTLKTADRFRTIPNFQYDLTPGLAAGIVGSQLTATPGSNTWHLKSVSGASPSDLLSNAQVAYLKGKNGNYYLTVAGNGRYFNGFCSGGEYADVVQTIDWIYARTQEAVVTALSVGPKNPFTAAGIAKVQTAVLNVLNLAVKNGGLTDNPAPTVTVPVISEVSAADKAARRLTGVTFRGELAGAIHFVDGIVGTIGT